MKDGLTSTLWAGRLSTKERRKVGRKNTLHSSLTVPLVPSCILRIGASTRAWTPFSRSSPCWTFPLTSSFIQTGKIAKAIATSTSTDCWTRWMKKNWPSWRPQQRDYKMPEKRRSNKKDLRFFCFCSLFRVAAKWLYWKSDYPEYIIESQQQRDLGKKCSG